MNSDDLSKMIKKYEQLKPGEEEYLICARDAGCEYEVSNLFIETKTAFRTLAADTCEAHSATKNHMEALKPKINAATMGGIVSGIAGPAAGIYAAAQTAESNASKDAARIYYEQEAYNCNKKQTQSIATFSSCVEKLETKIKQLSNTNLAKKDIAYRITLEAKQKQASCAVKGLEKNLKNDTIIRKNFIPFLATSLFSLIVTIFIFAVELTVLGVIMGIVTAIELFGVCLGGIAMAQQAKEQKALDENKAAFSIAEQELRKYKKIRKTHSYAREACAICDTMKKKRASSPKTKKSTT